MKKIEAKIVADSISPQGHRITSMLLTYPRFIHGEVMTHRMFSRNSASSRAIPFEKMVKMVEEDPFIPIAWQKDHKGMQGTEYIRGNKEIQYCIDTWLRGRDYSIRVAKTLNKKAAFPKGDFDSSYEDINVSKQLCNRLLEPFMWHTVLVTATEWDNFFELRCRQYPYWFYNCDGSQDCKILKSKKDFIEEHGSNAPFYSIGGKKFDEMSDLDWIKFSNSGAEIHIQTLAESMWDAINENTPKQLKAGEWHIPFGDNISYIPTPSAMMVSSLSHQQAVAIEQKIKVATARCARLSYMTHDGEIDYEKDIKLHDSLLKNYHMSPFEHCARAMNDSEYKEFVKTKLGKMSHEWDYGWCNNFRGWIQYRYLIEKHEPS